MSIQLTPTYGEPHYLAPEICRVIANNPSPMTYWGTNTYIIGSGALTVIDPGPDDELHFQALNEVIAGRQVSHILVTHSHLDHSPLAKGLSTATGAKIYAFGPSEAGRSAKMQMLGQSGLVGGGEGIDHSFSPDVTLADGAVLETPAGVIRALHTPGHIGNHMCFQWNNAVFCGDHVMGWASSLVSPPDGDLGDFLSSCERLKSVATGTFYPAHGNPIAQPHERLEWLIDHRNQRSAQILAALQEGPATAAELTTVLYVDTPQALWPAAERNVLAHLIHLTQRGEIKPIGNLQKDATFLLNKTDETIK